MGIFMCSFYCAGSRCNTASGKPASLYPEAAGTPLSRIPGRIFPGQPGIVFTAADPVPAHPQPADPLFIGLLGSLVGSFSAFSLWEAFAGLVPWGYYMVGMTLSSVYEESTRSMFIEEAPFAWGWFAAFWQHPSCFIWQEASFLKKRRSELCCLHVCVPN